MTTNPSPIRLALATCVRLPQLDEDSHFLWQALIPQLAAAGIVAQPVVWNDPTVDWGQYDAVWLRSPWDYVSQLGAFVGWIDHLENDGVTLWNAPEVLRWNTDKRYLKDLEMAGFSVLKTAWIESEFEMASSFTFDSSDVVVKPIVGASGKGMAKGNWLDANFLETVNALLKSQLPGGLMVQPYCKAIETDGEVSVVVWAGKVSHVTQKRPASGEYRIHPEYGGCMEGLALTEPWLQPLIEQTEAMVAWCNQRFNTTLLYARADFIKNLSGSWCLNELELTEPCLYAKLALPQSIAFLGQEIIRRVC
ncbi:MAG: hypothetical protein QE263_02800 [Vampirovibrionales bacterium]|nr:hypothetical protein [Vampirovibrionales bacterium]